MKFSEDDSVAVNKKHQARESKAAGSEQCDTGDKYTHPAPKTRKNSESQPLESIIQENEGNKTNNENNIDVNQPREGNVQYVKEEKDERPALEQIGTQRRYSGNSVTRTSKVN